MASFPEVKFVIRGDSDFEIDAARYPNLDVKAGRIPVEEVEALEAECDILISLSGRYTVMPPGKTFYYASYNKPILVIVDGPRADFMLEYLNGLGRYVCCRNDAHSLADGLRRAIKALPTYEREIPVRMKLASIARNLVTNPNKGAT